MRKYVLAKIVKSEHARISILLGNAVFAQFTKGETRSTSAISAYCHSTERNVSRDITLSSTSRSLGVS
jgi:hypothetical protein